MATPAVIEKIKATDLAFDRANPRMVGYGIQPTTAEEEVIKTLWVEMAVDEVAMSIAASGFWPHEPLIVANEDGKWVVIEGNRRLAAVRVLTNAALAAELGTNLGANLSLEVRGTLEELPVIKSTREESWRYMGFRHVNGPARWGSYAKAEYVRKVRSEYDVPLAEIARTIGDRHRTVQRLYRALMVLDQAATARVYSLNDRTKKNLPFSHLYIGLDYPGFQQFLNLRPEDEETEEPVPTENLPNLGQLLVWLFGSKKDRKPPIIKSQNPDLRRLDKVLTNSEARRAVERGTSLEDAVVLAYPAKDRLRNALLDAKSKLQGARGIVPEGYNGEEDILRTSGTVANLADGLYQELTARRAQVEKQPNTTARLTDADV
jgi:hypothetical protein